MLASFWISDLEERLGVTHREAAPFHVFLNFPGQIEQAYVVGNARALFADLLPHLFLSRTALDQRAIRIGELDRIQVLPLNVFNDRDFESLLGSDTARTRPRTSARRLDSLTRRCARVHVSATA